MSRRFVRLVLTVCPLLLSGCIIPYTYPRLSCTPGLAFDAPVEVVHAFRVDFTNYTADIGSFLPEDGVQQLSEISLDSAPNVPAQAKLSVDYGFLLIGVALNYFIHTNHTVGLRIYRPGFELVEIHSWERGEQIAWKPATDIAAREETLHRLFPISRLDPECKTEQHK